MFIMTPEDLLSKVPILTHHYSYNNLVQINENSSNISQEMNSCSFILNNNQQNQYKSTNNQINNEEASYFYKPLNFTNIPTIPTNNLTIPHIIRNENPEPEIDKNNGDEIDAFQNSNEDISSDCDDISDGPVFEENYQPFIINPPINSENTFGQNNNFPQIIRPNNTNYIPRFRREHQRQSSVNLTPEAIKFRDSFYNCYGDKKRFSKSIVKDIHNSICGALGLPKMSRTEYRSIFLYFNNFAPYRHRIIQAINLKKGFLMEPLQKLHQARLHKQALKSNRYQIYTI